MTWWSFTAILMGPAFGFMVARVFFPRIVKVTKAVRSVAIPTTSSDDGPYRTAAEVLDEPARSRDAFDDMRFAVADAVARANSDLRKGKLTAYEYGEKLDYLRCAAVKAELFRDAIRKAVDS